MPIHQLIHLKIHNWEVVDEQFGLLSLQHITLDEDY
jgi:hypothetical protein